MVIQSRFSRIEEKKTKRNLTYVVGAIVILVVAIPLIGLPLLVKVSGLLGNSKDSAVITNNDTTPPVPPVLSPILSATNSAKLKVEGYGEPATTLELKVNDESVKKVLLGNDGSFSFSDIILNPGSNTIVATSKDSAGNLSNPSKIWTILLKKKGPTLEVRDPTDGQNFDHSHQTITIKGKTDPQTQLSVNDRFVFVKDDGTFEYSLKLSDGDNTLTFKATDTAGNETKLERKVKYNP
jgi:hypothetical protein